MKAMMVCLRRFLGPFTNSSPAGAAEEAQPAVSAEHCPSGPSQSRIDGNHFMFWRITAGSFYLSDKNSTAGLSSGSHTGAWSQSDITHDLPLKMVFCGWLAPTSKSRMASE